MSKMQKNSLIATAAIFCCRFTGLLREITFTAFFGATGALDAFLTAYRIPNMLRDMFAEGALSQSFTSVMSKVQKREGTDAAWQLASRVIAQLMMLMLCIVSLGILSAGFMMQKLYPERANIALVTAPSSAYHTISEAAGSTGAVVISSDKTSEGIHTLSLQSLSPVSYWAKEASLPLSHIDELSLGDKVIISKEGITLSDGRLLKVEKLNPMQLATRLCRIMWPFILFASISALCMGSLNVFGFFGLPNLASAGFNLTLLGLGIPLAWWIDPDFGPNALYGFAIAVLFGGLAQILIQLPKMRASGFRFHLDLGLTRKGWRFSFVDANVSKVWYLMLPGLIAAGITQSNIFINTSFALYLPGGSVTALSSAFHLWQLPVALFGVAMGMVVLPSISRMTLVGDDSSPGDQAKAKRAIAHHLALALRFVALFALPSAVFLGIWGEQIVSIFFQRGRFDANSAAMTGQVLEAYSLGLMAYAGMKVLQPIFMALEKPWAPAGLALLSFTISVTLNYIFVHVLGMGVSWLALTTAAVTTLNFLFFFFYLRYLLGSMSIPTLFAGLARIGLASAVLAAFCWLIREYAMQDFTSWSFMSRFALMAACGIAGTGIYLGACYICRVPELRDFLMKLRSRSNKNNKAH